MFFATTTPTSLRRSAYPVTGRSLERWLDEALLAPRQGAGCAVQDEKSYALSFDLPGIAKEQLSIGIEGNVVRIETIEGAPRQYRTAYELPQDIDASASEAKLENGVLTIKLAKKAPVSNVVRLTVS